MRVIREHGELRDHFGGVFVPTMGALHDGHLALMRHGRSLGGPLVVSIFVNPTQFGPGEDWQRYPRTLDADLAAVESVGADVVFTPDVETMYPPDTPVSPPPLPAVATEPGLEDACRPGHFAGVCQVVARLFELVRPAVAVFGEKDYQQLLVIRAMAAGAPPEIVAHPTVREPDGLALSSRNAYLTAPQRDQALGLSRALAAAGRDADAEHAMNAVLVEHGLAVDYAVVRDAATLLPLADEPTPARALVAARLGDVRLIDNTMVT